MCASSFLSLDYFIVLILCVSRNFLHSSFIRKAPVSGGRKVKDVNNRKITLGGSTEGQVVAANIDIIFLVTAADENYNLRRLERYILFEKKSGMCDKLLFFHLFFHLKVLHGGRGGRKCPENALRNLWMAPRFYWGRSEHVMK